MRWSAVVFHSGAGLGDSFQRCCGGSRLPQQGVARMRAGEGGWLNPPPGRFNLCLGGPLGYRPPMRTW